MRRGGWDDTRIWDRFTAAMNGRRSQSRWDRVRGRLSRVLAWIRGGRWPS